ncbi:MAG: hypothetical protein H0U49_11995 [Parachlamydiaceae bacterium]|nr:hypothetical protein [Parachlamydiaceae bacterium]
MTRPAISNSTAAKPIEALIQLNHSFIMNLTQDLDTEILSILIAVFVIFLRNTF